MGTDGGRWLLRPAGGGREWVCPGEAAVPVSASEWLDAEAKAANERGRRGR